MNLKQAFETLHTIMYDKDDFNNPAVICKFTKDSLIKVFKDNKKEFTNKYIKVIKTVVRKCIVSQFNQDYYDNLTPENLDDLLVLLQHIIDIPEPSSFKYDSSSKYINNNYS